MRRRVVHIPAEVRGKAAAQGARGVRWLEGLGDAIEEFERAWQMRVGATLSGGSDSYVAEATTADGTPAVFKLALPGDGAAHEIEALVLADGRGYVRLLRYDAERQAMLQERLGISLAQLSMPVERQVEVLCDMLRRAWDVPPDPGFPSGAQKARWLAEFIAATWEQLNRPCSEPAIERALSFADAREAAFDPDSAVLIHGDAHAANALAVPRRRAADGALFRFVDPDGLFAERALDLAVAMRGWSRELLEGDTLRRGRERCAHLSRLTGTDEQPIWEWGYIERVSTGLLALQVGRERLGRDMLAVAEVFAPAMGPRHPTGR
jgi:streptomycin 6-kinase